MSDAAQKYFAERDDLDQSEAGMKRRHGAICDAWGPWGLPKAVLDLGCGNGDILKALTERSMPVSLYHGADFVDRGNAAMFAASEVGCIGRFTLVPPEESTPFETVMRDGEPYGAIICTGVFGYYGMASFRRLRMLWSSARAKAPRVAITLPIQHPNDMGRPWLARFAMEDLKAEWPHNCTKISDGEALLSC